MKTLLYRIKRLLNENATPNIYVEVERVHVEKVCDALEKAIDIMKNIDQYPESVWPIDQVRAFLKEGGVE